MRNVKTAISLQKSLFEQADKLARKMKVSRSHLFVLALEEYIKQQENRQLLARINAAYAEEPDEDEQLYRLRSRQQHRRIVKGEW